MALWRIQLASGPRWAVGSPDEGPRTLLPEGIRLDRLLARGAGAVVEACGADGPPVPAGVPLLAPVDHQPVWAAGVTFARSKEARREESGGADLYDRVYDAARPELFAKAFPGTARGPEEAIGIRSDSSWDVPEPELALVIDAFGDIAGYTIGNDVSSRSIEGANALYLPQAKLYEGSCALGPCIVVPSEAPPPSDMTIELRISRDESEIFEDSTSVSAMHRSLADLVAWLQRGQTLERGAVLFCGTSIVPPSSLTLRAGDVVSISITGLGHLRNFVQTVGTEAPPEDELHQNVSTQ